MTWRRAPGPGQISSSGADMIREKPAPTPGKPLPQVRGGCPVSLAGPQLCCAGALSALSVHFLHLRQTRPFLVHLMPRWNPSGCGVQGPTRKVRPLAARGEAVGRVGALGLLPNPCPHWEDHRCSPLGCQCHSGQESSCLRNILTHAGDSLVSSKRLFVEHMLLPKAGVWGEVDVDVVSSAPLPGDCHCETKGSEKLCCKEACYTCCIPHLARGALFIRSTHWHLKDCNFCKCHLENTSQESCSLAFTKWSPERVQLFFWAWNSSLSERIRNCICKALPYAWPWRIWLNKDSKCWKS